MGSDPPGQVELPDDGYLWLKYGEKRLLKTATIRYYFKCSRYKAAGCKARRYVDFDKADPSVSAPEVKYQGTHNHDPLQALKNIRQGFLRQHLKLKMPKYASELGLSRQAARVPKRLRSEGGTPAQQREHGAETHVEERGPLKKTLSPGSQAAGGTRGKLGRYVSGEGETAVGGMLALDLKKRNAGESDKNDKKNKNEKNENNVEEFGKTLLGSYPRRTLAFLGPRKSFDDLLSMGVARVPLEAEMQGTRVAEDFQRSSSFNPKPDVFLRSSMLNRKPEPSVRLSGPDFKTGEQQQEHHAVVLQTTNVIQTSEPSPGEDIKNSRQSGVLDISEQRRAQGLEGLEEVVRGALSLTTFDLEPWIPGPRSARAGALGEANAVAQAQGCASLWDPEHMSVAGEGDVGDQTGGALQKSTLLLPVGLPREDSRSREMHLGTVFEDNVTCGPKAKTLLFDDSCSLIQRPGRISKYDELFEAVAPFISPQIIREVRTNFA